LVLNNLSAGAGPKLVALLQWIDGGEGVLGVEFLIAEEPVSGAMELITSAARDCVHHAAGSVSELRRVVVGHNLKLLHGVLRNLRRDARSAGVLVVILIGRIVSIRQER